MTIIHHDPESPSYITQRRTGPSFSRPCHTPCAAICTEYMHQNAPLQNMSQFKHVTVHTGDASQARNSFRHYLHVTNLLSFLWGRHRAGIDTLPGSRRKRHENLMNTSYFEAVHKKETQTKMTIYDGVRMLPTE